MAPSAYVRFDNFHIRSWFNLYRTYLERIEPQVDELLQDWQVEFENAKKEIDDEYLEMFWGDKSAEYQELLEIRSILLNSFFAASFALFEHLLARTCERVRNSSGNPFTVRDMSGGSPTDRAKKYLETLGVEFPSSGSEWKEVTTLRDIRNNLMHNGGVLLPTGETTKYAKEQNIAGPSKEDNPIEGSYHLDLTREFCERVLDSLEEFLVKISNEYDLWRARQ